MDQRTFFTTSPSCAQMLIFPVCLQSLSFQKSLPAGALQDDALASFRLPGRRADFQLTVTRTETNLTSVEYQEKCASLRLEGANWQQTATFSQVYSVGPVGVNHKEAPSSPAVKFVSESPVDAHRQRKCPEEACSRPDKALDETQCFEDQRSHLGPAGGIDWTTSAVHSSQQVPCISTPKHGCVAMTTTYTIPQQETTVYHQSGHMECTWSLDNRLVRFRQPADLALPISRTTFPQTLMPFGNRPESAPSPAFSNSLSDNQPDLGQDREPPISRRKRLSSVMSSASSSAGSTRQHKPNHASSWQQSSTRFEFLSWFTLHQFTIFLPTSLTSSPTSLTSSPTSLTSSTTSLTSSTASLHQLADRPHQLYRPPSPAKHFELSSAQESS